MCYPLLPCISELLLLLLAVERTRQSLLVALAAISLVWPALSVLLSAFASAMAREDIVEERGPFGSGKPLACLK